MKIQTHTHTHTTKYQTKHVTGNKTEYEIRLTRGSEISDGVVRQGRTEDRETYSVKHRHDETDCERHRGTNRDGMRQTVRDTGGHTGTG